MNAEFSRLRRFAIAAASLGIAAVLFRPQIADALIVRGDDYVYRGQSDAALERYRRALAVWPFSQTAADRYVFLRMQQNTARSLHDGIDTATRFLEHTPGSGTVLFDRALCYLHEKRYEPAFRDFRRAARVEHTPQAFVFAGWAAERAGHRAAAILLWKDALLVQTGYRPALLALSEHRS